MLVWVCLAVSIFLLVTSSPVVVTAFMIALTVVVAIFRISKNRDKGSNNNFTSTGNGQPKAPHLRRAHKHTYRVGKGRKQTIVKWIDTIEVNRNSKKK
jgi:hypothetical protein